MGPYVAFAIVFVIWVSLYCALLRDRNEIRNRILENVGRHSEELATLRRENQYLKSVLLREGFTLRERTDLETLSEDRACNGPLEEDEESEIAVCFDSSGPSQTPDPVPRPSLASKGTVMLRSFLTEVVDCM
jgi:hypothetical protein